MEEKGNYNRTRGRLWLLLPALLLLGLLLWLGLSVKIGGHRYLRADEIDARREELSCEEYAAAAQALPGSRIRWLVPIGDERFDSASEELTLTSLPFEQVGRLFLFPELRRIDASACPDSASLAEARRRLEGVELRYRLDTPDGAVDSDATSLTVRRTGYEELRALLTQLDALQTLDVTDSALSEDEIDALARSFPELHILRSLSLGDETIRSDSEELVLDADTTADFDALLQVLTRMDALKRVDLSALPLTAGELAELLPLCPADTRFTLSLLGLNIPWDCEELDLSGIPVTEPDEIETAAELLPRLQKVVMCDCGVPDEEMDALDGRHETVRFVWSVHFSVYTLRTDATVFCASNLPSHGYIAPQVSSETLSPLRYCRDLEALDLGHMMFRDLDFLEGLTKLRYLILVEERFHDISVLGTMENLEYLELFNNTIDDITPLLNLTRLRHLNLGYTRGYDPAPLAQMTWLERLWYPGQRIGQDKAAEIIAALPDTECYFPTYDPMGSTGGGWRENAAYYDMRNAFGMFYQPGGTGTGNNG